MDEQAGFGTARVDLAEDLVERQGTVRELSAERHAEDEKRRGQAPRNDDFGLAQLLERQRLARHDHGAIPGADRGAVGQQRVAVLDERIRGQRQRGDLEPALEGPLVQNLDVLRHELELESTPIDRPAGERPDHEGIVGVGGMPDSDQHRAEPRLCAWPSPR